MTVIPTGDAVPTGDSITASWLTDRLHDAGHPAGQIGKCSRFGLDLQGNDPTAPHSLVGEFPSDDPLSRATGVALEASVDSLIEWAKTRAHYGSEQQRAEVVSLYERAKRIYAAM